MNSPAIASNANQKFFFTFRSNLVKRGIATLATNCREVVEYVTYASSDCGKHWHRYYENVRGANGSLPQVPHDANVGIRVFCHGNGVTVGILPNKKIIPIAASNVKTPTPNINMSS